MTDYLTARSELLRKNLADGEDEKDFQSFAKPVKFSKIALTSRPRVPATVLAALDDPGKYSEIFWEDSQVTALTNYPKLPVLSTTSDKCKVSQFAMTGMCCSLSRPVGRL